jgi:hypothetical protein
MKKNRHGTMSWTGPPSIQPCLKAMRVIVETTTDATNGATIVSRGRSWLATAISPTSSPRTAEATISWPVACTETPNPVANRTRPTTCHALENRGGRSVSASRRSLAWLAVNRRASISSMSARRSVTWSSGGTSGTAANDALRSPTVSTAGRR